MWLYVLVVKADHGEGVLGEGEGEERTMESSTMKAEGGLLREEAATEERQEGSREGGINKDTYNDRYVGENALTKPTTLFANLRN